MLPIAPVKQHSHIRISKSPSEISKKRFALPQQWNKVMVPWGQFCFASAGTTTPFANLKRHSLC